MTTIQLGYNYETLKTSIRYWLHGRGYNTALKAMDLGLKWHIDLRKDGLPEFSHQIFQVAYARSLADLMLHPENTLAVIFLHDLVEDHNPEQEVVDDGFGEEIGRGVELMTNVDCQGNKKGIASYYAMMEYDPLASIAKGVDRMHNFQSMAGVFGLEKQKTYIAETERFIIPMLKNARKNFPEQEPVYQNIKHVLRTQIELFQLTHKLAQDEAFRDGLAPAMV
jgi:(p)ppGpp synthase/HD superfamily hydrolase